MYRLIYIFSVALMVIVSVNADSIDDETIPQSPLLTMLAGVPQEFRDGRDFIYFIDYAMTEVAYGVARPSNIETFITGMSTIHINDPEQHEAGFLEWVAAIREQYTSLYAREMRPYIEVMPDLVGFSPLAIDQELYFNDTPKLGAIFRGNFNIEAIVEAYRINFDFEPIDFDGATIWCWAGGCEAGQIADPDNRTQGNPFGGLSGQRYPMVINDNMLMASASISIVQKYLVTSGGLMPSLADIPAYRAGVNAVDEGAYLLQAVIADGETLDSTTGVIIHSDQIISVIDEMLVTYQDLPSFELWIMADVLTPDEQITRFGFVYHTVEDAELAAPVLMQRIREYITHSRMGSLMNYLERFQITEPRYFMYEEDGMAVVVVEFPTRRPTYEELPRYSLSPRDLPSFFATTPSLIFKAFMNMALFRDLGWMSVMTRAQLEEIRDANTP